MGSNELGETLRALRRQKGLSRLALADASDVSATYITQIEGGVDPRTGKPFQPSPAVLRRLAAALAEGDTALEEATYRTLMAAAEYLPPQGDGFFALEQEAPLVATTPPPASERKPPAAPSQAAASTAAGSTLDGYRPAADWEEVRARAELSLVLERWGRLSADERGALYQIARLIARHHGWSGRQPRPTPGGDGND